MISLCSLAMECKQFKYDNFNHIFTSKATKIYVNIIVGDSLDVECPWIYKSKIHGQENSMNSFRK